MTRRLSRPHYIAEIGRCVVEYIYPEAFIVCTGNEGVAGTEAGPQHAKIAIAFRLQPIERRANIGDPLPSGVDGTAHVGRHGIVRTLQFCGSPDVVVGGTHPQHRNAHRPEDARETVVADAVGVPLR